jgi:hypothetical protein
MWELLVVNLGHRPSSSFGKNFYRLPFTRPLSGRLIAPSSQSALGSSMIHLPPLVLVASYNRFLRVSSTIMLARLTYSLA